MSCQQYDGDSEKYTNVRALSVSLHVILRHHSLQSLWALYDSQVSEDGVKLMKREPPEASVIIVLPNEMFRIFWRKSFVV